MLDAVPGLDLTRRPAEDPDVIVDALFGTGLTRDVAGAAAEAVRG